MAIVATNFDLLSYLYRLFDQSSLFSPQDPTICPEYLFLNAFSNDDGLHSHFHEYWRVVSLKRP